VKIITKLWVCLARKGKDDLREIILSKLWLLNIFFETEGFKKYIETKQYIFLLYRISKL
jgi:hypothetical protein